MRHPAAIELRGDAQATLENSGPGGPGDEVAEFLLLQGRPIAEPVHGHDPTRFARHPDGFVENPPV